ncbi:hypothetical protein N431DRAFT_428128 [Stipitochalara longipes BDJ]|nr:hypothetical protein N431DRAFT_428128 [Stipitochalara longipes BDJ]
MNSTFHPFPSLPLELRLKIWSHLLPAPRIVDIIAVSADERQQLCDLSGENTVSSPKWVTSFVDHMQSPHQSLPALFYVNRETRGLVLKRWKVLQGIQVLGMNEMRRVGYDRFEEEDRKAPVWRIGWRVKGPEAHDDTGAKDSIFYLHPPSLNTPPVLFNPEIDLLFLADPPSTRKVSSLSVLVRWLDKDIVESVKNLAIPYYSWRKDYTFGKIGCLRDFKELQRLWVTFVGDEGRENAGWLAAVRGEVGQEQGEPYLCEIREQIRGDVAMERSLVGWERPVVRVVKDRGVVMRELGECGTWVKGMGKHGCFPYCGCMRTPERVTD